MIPTSKTEPSHLRLEEDQMVSPNQQPLLVSCRVFPQVGVPFDPMEIPNVAIGVLQIGDPCFLLCLHVPEKLQGPGLRRVPKESLRCQARNLDMSACN